MKYFNEITERLVWSNSKKEITNGFVSGQIKLLLNEIFFLDECIKIHEKKNMAFNILYIGSGKGYHIPLLIDMFSSYKINWHLFDPNKHCKKLYMLKKSIKNLFITDDYFREEDIENYKLKENLLLISDFRTFTNESPTEEELVNDIQLQNNFLKKLNPLFSLLKYRLPFPSENELKFEKPIGLEILQAFNKHDSCEFRIFLTQNVLYEKIVDKNILLEYEEKFNWYNRMYRQQNQNDLEIAYGILSQYYNNNVKSKKIEKDDILNHILFLKNSF